MPPVITAEVYHCARPALAGQLLGRAAVHRRGNGSVWNTALAADLISIHPGCTDTHKFARNANVSGTRQTRDVERFEGARLQPRRMLLSLSSRASTKERSDRLRRERSAVLSLSSRRRVARPNDLNPFEGGPSKLRLGGDVRELRRFPVRFALSNIPVCGLVCATAITWISPPVRCR